MSGPAQLLQNSALQAAANAPAFAAIERRLGSLQEAVASPPQIPALQWNKLELTKVAFEHQPDRGVRGFSLAMRRGDWVGIRGASGAGKTTIVDLVAGLLAPQQGRISVDGVALADVIERWQGAIAYVGQDGVVFSDSVRGNLLAEGASADHVDLWHALETVGLAERVRAFPDGLNQTVGERGSQLSGGERQRLLLARALLRKPSLLILDEATAALDAVAEGQLIERLKAIKPRPAALVVAHRESTHSHCDSIVSTQDGRLTAV
jgi:ATP-binding cassette subfamily C protein